MEKLFQANRIVQKAGVPILTLDKIDFKTKSIKREKRGHYIIISSKIHQEDITLINIYAPKDIGKILEDFKKDIDSNILTAGDF